MSRRMNIPSVGDIITLAAPWTFHVRNEYRNAALIAALNLSAAPESLKSAPGAGPLEPMPPMELHSWHPLGTQGHAGSFTVNVAWSPTPVVHQGYPEYQHLYAWATLPAGTKLRVDRIYLRKGGHQYDSLTFTVPMKEQTPSVQAFFMANAKPLAGGKRQIRFFAPLSDVNQMEVED